MKEYSEFFSQLEKLISIKSVKSAPEKDMPFGKGVYDALHFTLNLAKDWGFETKNYDNYVGEIIFGEGKELGIIGHVDVVPEGDGWNTDPYKIHYGEDRLFARGVQDDKGPTLLCLYALKKLKDEGIVPKRKVRFFIGCDEESGWSDVAYYLKENTFPEEGFSPDGNFPVVYAEKGRSEIVFTIPVSKNVKNFKGGTVSNAVCAHATVESKIDSKLLEKFGLKNQGNTIISIGKSAHGSKPELGKNAILPLLKYLSELGENTQNAVEYLFEDKLGITKIGNSTGNATMSPNLIRQEGDNLIITVDFRVPAKMTIDDFIPYFEKMNMEYKITKGRKPHYVSPESDFVNTLLGAYNKETGEKAKPISQCGATFSSVFKNGCAFGPEFFGEDGAIHEPNEYLLYKNVDLMFKIYKTALKELLC